MRKIYNKENILYINDDNKEVARVDFVYSNNSIIITHTFVDDSLRGQGIAKKLMQDIENIALRDNKKLEATCSYAKRYLENK